MDYKHDLIHVKKFVFWRLTFRISMKKLVNTTHCKCEIRVLAYDILLICS